MNFSSRRVAIAAALGFTVVCTVYLCSYFYVRSKPHPGSFALDYALIKSKALRSFVEVIHSPAQWIDSKLYERIYWDKRDDMPSPDEFPVPEI